MDVNRRILVLTADKEHRPFPIAISDYKGERAEYRQALVNKMRLFPGAHSVNCM